MRDFAEDITGSSTGLLALLGVLLSLFLGDSVLQEEPFAELGYALVLLSMFGAAVYGGHLVRSLLRSRTGLAGPYPLLPVSTQAMSGRNGRGRERPALVTLLLSSLCFLFAGLAGWVEGRARRY